MRFTKSNAPHRARAHAVVTALVARGALPFLLGAAFAVLLAACGGPSVSSGTTNQADAGRIGCGADNGGCGPSDAWGCYETTGNRAVCFDRNECQLTPDVCSQDPRVSCANTEGGYECGPCPAGYAGDGHTCTAPDECATNNGGCGNSAFFTCTDSASASPVCSDIDECLANNGGCGAVPRFVCTNNAGAAPTCVDLGACAVNNGGCGSASAWVCTNNSGGAPTCTDINECLSNNGGCSTAPMVTCTNSPGSYACGACPSGYSGDGHTCTDINECVLDTDGCWSGTRCNNVPGSFGCISCPLANQVAVGAPGPNETCACAPGYMLVDGICAWLATYSATLYVVSPLVVYDSATGRRWQRAQSQMQYNQAAAASYCSTLTLDGVGGWRLPTRAELLSIVDAVRTPTINPWAFNFTTSTYFWTSTLLVTGTHHTVSFQTGQYWSEADGVALDVRCVR